MKTVDIVATVQKKDIRIPSEAIYIRRAAHAQELLYSCGTTKQNSRNTQVIDVGRKKHEAFRAFVHLTKLKILDIRMHSIHCTA